MDAIDLYLHMIAWANENKNAICDILYKTSLYLIGMFNNREHRFQKSRQLVYDITQEFPILTLEENVNGYDFWFMKQLRCSFKSASSNDPFAYHKAKGFLGDTIMSVNTHGKGETETPVDALFAFRAEQIGSGLPAGFGIIWYDKAREIITEDQKILKLARSEWDVLYDRPTLGDSKCVNVYQEEEVNNILREQEEETRRKLKALKPILTHLYSQDE